MLHKELIFIGLDVTTAEQAIRIMAEQMLIQGYVKESFIEAVLQREETFPTGMPTTLPVSIPHTNVEHCLKPAISVGILKQPVEFRTMGEPTRSVPVQLVFLLSVVEPSVQVQMLHRLIDFFQQTEKLQELARVETVDQAYELLCTALGVESHAVLPAPEPTAANMTETMEVVVRHPVGLHARPAAKFVQLANQFPCDILVSNLESNTPPANAKSILGVLSLGVSSGHRIRIQAKGEQATEALQALRDLIESNFGENSEPT